jgi:hypothetical protein
MTSSIVRLMMTALGCFLAGLALQAQEIDIRQGGSPWARIEADKAIRIGGTIEGYFESGGDVRKSGSLVGSIERDGTIRRKGTIIGRVENDGGLRREGTLIGAIEEDGTIRLAGSIWGQASPCCPEPLDRRVVAAVLVFFIEDFFGRIP